VTTVASTVGKFVWHEQVSGDPKQAQDFYTQLFGWGVEIFRPGEMDYAAISSGDQTHGGFGKAMEGAPPPHWLGHVHVEKLEDTIAITEEIYVCSLAWVREQRSGQTIHEGEPKITSEFAERLPNAVEACADRIDQHQRQIADQDQTPIEFLIERTDFVSSKSADSLGEVLTAVTELQVLVSTRERL